MKLGVLVNNSEILERLYKTRLDGKRALKLRRTIKRLNEELQTFEEAKNERIKEVGETDEQGNMMVHPGTEEYNELVQYLNEMSGTEIEDIDPVLSTDDLETLDLSVEDIDRIEHIGLLKNGEVERYEKDVG